MRVLQDMGLPVSAQEVLYEKFQNVAGEVKYLPRFEKRLRGYTSKLFYNERVPLFEYVMDPTFGAAESSILVEVQYIEELHGVVWSCGPMVFKQLVDPHDETVVCKWPTHEDGSIITDEFPLRY